MDMFAIVGQIFSPLVGFLLTVLGIVSLSLILASSIFLLCFWLRCRPLTISHLLDISLKFKPFDFCRWLLCDLKLKVNISQKPFNEYGFSIYCGRQGAGKTISMVEYLERMRKDYPRAKIVTNFYYAHSHATMLSWRALFDIRNGDDGVIFAIDEIHSEYSSSNWKDFPESLLSEISQQRKQRMKIVATAQVFSRIAKPIREQAFSVFVCSTYAGRLTRVKEYDAADYGVTQDSAYVVKEKCKPIRKYSFVQSNALRSVYDTYQKINRLEKVSFIPRSERH